MLRILIVLVAMAGALVAGGVARRIWDAKSSKAAPTEAKASRKTGDTLLVGAKGAVMCISVSALKEIIDSPQKETVMGLNNMMHSGKAFKVPSGTEVLILGYERASGVAVCRLRIVGGAHSGEVGYICTDFTEDWK